MISDATASARPDAKTATAARPRPAWRRWVGLAAAFALGVVLLVAAWAKAIDPAAFAGQIRAEGLDVLLSAQAVVLVALALEVGIGLALVLGLRRLWVLIPAALLIAFFLFLTGRTYWRSTNGIVTAAEAAGCGCFGNLVERSPAAAFWQDLALLVPLLLLSFVGRERGRTFPPVRTALVAALTVAALAFAWKAPELPLDDLATRLKPGAEVTGLCAGGAGAEATRVCLDTVAPELAQGEHLVVLADLEDPGFTARVGDLNGYALDGRGPTPWVLAAATPEQHQSFFWRFGPAFQVREAPAALLKPLYRRLPRSFVVRDGRVTRTFQGLPPLETLAAGVAAGGPA